MSRRPLRHPIIALLPASLLCSALSLGAAHAEDLVTVYQLARQHDTTLRAADQARLAVRENITVVRGRLRPNVGLGAEISRSRSDSQSLDAFDSISTPRGVSLQLSQSLYNKPQQVQLEQANQQADQADLQYQDAELRLVTQVAKAYFDVLKARANLSYTRSQKIAVARQLEQTEKRFEVGLIAITDVKEAQARFDQATAAEIVAENQVQSALEALGQITGAEHQQIADLAGPIPLLPPEPTDPARWVEAAEQGNFGLKAQQVGVEVAQREIERQRAAHLPTVEVVASQGYNYGRASGLDNESFNTSVGLQLNWSLYGGGSIDASTRNAAYRYQQALEELDGSRREIKRTTRDAYRGVVAGISQVKALEQAVVSAETALKATEAGYEVGTRTVVEVLDSEQQLLQAQRDLATARYDYLYNSLLLKQAAGMLTETDLTGINVLLAGESQG